MFYRTKNVVMITRYRLSLSMKANIPKFYHISRLSLNVFVKKKNNQTIAKGQIQTKMS